MKNFLIGLNIVLLLAVGVLYYLFFSAKKADSKPSMANLVSDSAAVGTGSVKMVYFESDSLEKQYEYYKEVRSALRQKDEENVRKLTNLRNEFNNTVKGYQQKGSSMTQNEQTQAQQTLQQMESEYQNTAQQQQQDMQAESMRRLQEVKMKIQDFLKDYAKEKGFVFVFGTNEYDYLYYKDPSRDITADVVRLLNERYKAEKSAKKK
ncbi:periplasmic chaperone for outer membrane proteins Skp [Filimonas lacunae]|uniref:Periplasmic chaperone for outer membrane proteins Skp n=1 Tax=Filimonas lacunae TaxID=477680 RepID=A0A1N7RGA3_9BACT|nr:OmpH family outer membrane protein [Filimonas lacunae]SIT34014.1 periplasmic chaperone for outer membrane proteins Skp [Filimonas lacunae]